MARVGRQMLQLRWVVTRPIRSNRFVVSDSNSLGVSSHGVRSLVEGRYDVGLLDELLLLAVHPVTGTQSEALANFMGDRRRLAMRARRSLDHLSAEWRSAPPPAASSRCYSLGCPLPRWCQCWSPPLRAEPALHSSSLTLAPRPRAGGGLPRLGWCWYSDRHSCRRAPRLRLCARFIAAWGLQTAHSVAVRRARCVGSRPADGHARRQWRPGAVGDGCQRAVMAWRGSGRLERGPP
jgi:hypothetical protein